MTFNVGQFPHLDPSVSSWELATFRSEVHVLEDWDEVEFLFVPRKCLNSEEDLCSNSERVGCRIVLLEFPEFVRMDNGHEWGQVVSIPTHIHPLDSIRTKTRQIRQRASSHQQYNVGVDGPRRGIKLCVVQSTRVHEWNFGFERPYR
ncbi:uncharacterized protein TNCV_2378471 [Trichonephila clavipes]|nr:uncharacterized protein TNCV_2378471 [Trichonephila clavipes]